MFRNFRLSASVVLALLCAHSVARAADFELEGIAFFSNVQAGTQQGGIVPYLGIGESDLIGPDIQTGSIKNLTGLIPVDATTLKFFGEVGPHPWLPGHPNIHLITTVHGAIFCTWTAEFTLKFINANGDAIFSGDGDFRVIGGTGRYRNATGRFRTLFETGPVPFGADQATANVTQSGTISR